MINSINAGIQFKKIKVKIFKIVKTPRNCDTVVY